MKTEGLRDLIPLYVAKALDAEETKQVEEAIRQSDEVKGEVAFWRKIQLAAFAHAVTRPNEHATSEQIVDYAERAIVDANVRAQVESHLQACASCRDDYERIRSTIVGNDRPIAATSRVPKLRRFITSFKPIYALPAAAVVIAGVLLWRSFLSHDQPDGVRLILSYQGEMRSRDEELPIVVARAEAKFIELVLCLPHDSLPSTLYSATLTLPNGTDLAQQSALPKVIGRAEVDSVRVKFELKSPVVEGEYTLTLAEIPSSLPSGSSPFPPEPYRFRIVAR